MNSEDLQSLMEAYSKVHESSEELNETQVFEDITPERARYDAMVAARDKAQRAKTIQGQSQTAKALSSGKGINVKGAGLGADLGRGYGATYKGREAIRVPGAGQRGYEPEINAAGKRFFANVQGKDVIYTSNYKAGQKNLGVAPTAKPKVDPAADAKAKSDAQREKALADAAARNNRAGSTVPPANSNVISAKNIAGQSQQVTVGRQYGATLGGQKGNVTYNAQGQRTFTASPTSAAKPSTPTSPTTPAKPATGMLGNTSFERRIPTSAELKGAQAARAAGETNPEKVLQAAKSAGVTNKIQTTGSSVGSKPVTNQTPTAFSSPSLVKTPPINTNNIDIPKATAAIAKAAPTPTVAPAATATPKPTTPTPPVKPMTKPSTQLFHTDLFDLVKGHLLDEGYAETEEAAVVMMANMSDEWRESILEGYGVDLEETKKWIQKAIKKPGSLSKQLGVPEEENIPMKKLKAAAKKGGKLGKRANLAMTLKGLQKEGVDQDGDGDTDFADVMIARMKASGKKTTKQAIAATKNKSYNKEEVEAWVNELVEEGYDLSDFTWEEMAEIYMSELYKGRHGQSETEYMAGRSDAGKRISGDADTGPRYYTLGRSRGAVPDAPTKPGAKPVNTPKLSSSEKEYHQYRKSEAKNRAKYNKVGGSKGLPG